MPIDIPLDEDPKYNEYEHTYIPLGLSLVILYKE